MTSGGPRPCKPQGCVCGRHSAVHRGKCVIGCTCGLHTKGGPQPCIEGCTCRRHISRTAHWKGKRLSPEHRAAISRGSKGKGMGPQLNPHTATCVDPDCRSILCNPQPRRVTVPELALQALLSDFPEVETEKRFGSYHVDAYLPPPYHIAFEADGIYWHTLPGVLERDVRRDAWLLKHYDLPVVRLDEFDLGVR